MKHLTRTYSTVLRRTAAGLLALSLLVGMGPWACAETGAGELTGPSEESAGSELPAAETPAPEETAENEVSGEDPAQAGLSTLTSTTVTYPVTGGDLYFDTSTGTIVDCDMLVTNVSIPTVIEGVEVTRIGESAFNACRSLTSVDIPASVASIGERAFSDCVQLNAVTLPEGILEISANMFWRCSNLSGISIPESVKSIGANAFYGCENLTGLTIPAGVIQIGDGAFSGCEKLNNIVIPDGVTEISNGAFEYCDGLTDIELPDTITVIGEDAFHHCDSLTDMVLPDSVRDIGASAFEACVNLAQIELPLNLEGIDDYAFHGCGTLSAVVLPEGLDYIGERAFWECDSLKSVTIPASVASVREGAFNECSNLECIEVDESNPYYASLDGVFFNKTISCLIKFPDAKGGNYIIPASVRNISEAAFYECRKITGVTVPVGVTAIEAMTFSYCESLSSVNLPEGLISIGATAFDYCGSLKSISIPASVISIGDNAFRECTSLKSVIFQGDAPTLKPATFPYSRPFPEETTLYYPLGKSGWTTPTWNDGYNALPVVGVEGAVETHTDDYYAKLSDYYFHFVDQMAGDLMEVSLEFGGQTISSGSTSELTVAFAGTDPEQIVSFGKTGYHSAHIPLYVLGVYNHIDLYPETYKEPFVQAVYASQNGGQTYYDLLGTGMVFHAGSLTQQTSFYLDVNWCGEREGKLYLSQTLDPKDGFEVHEGLNDPFALSLYLKSGSGLYLLMVTGDGEIFSKGLSANILSESAALDLELGDAIDIPQPDNDFLSKFKFSLSLPKDMKIKMSVESDGTVLATVGVELAEEKDVSTAVKTIKDALYYADNYPRDWDSLVGALKGSIIPRSSSVVVSANCDFLGYAEGKLVQKEDGSYTVLFTEGKIAVKIEGKAQKTWQIYAWGAPFYVGGSIEPSLELKMTLWSRETGFRLSIDPMEVKSELPIKVRGGLGWDSIASAGIYGKGGITAEFTIPFSVEDLKIYADASLGAEAKFFCLKADIEICKTDKLYLYGEPEEQAELLQASMPDAGTLDWQPQSRDYLYDAGLLAVGEDDVQSGVQTVASSVYPYADVQLAALPDGTQLMVWTADPGEAARPEANNRTVLYYARNTRSGWSAPTPVESVDDGTADFNPLLTVLDGTAYLLWQDASRPLTAGDDASSTARAMDISTAAFDAASGTFASLGTVGTEYYDGAVSAGLTDGKLAVVWASNSGDNPLAADGQVGTLHRAVWDGGQFVTETLAEDLGAIDQTTTDGTSVWFSADTDYDSGTLNDREIRGQTGCKFDRTVGAGGRKRQNDLLHKGAERKLG